LLAKTRKAIASTVSSYGIARMFVLWNGEFDPVYGTL